MAVIYRSKRGSLLMPADDGQSVSGTRISPDKRARRQAMVILVQDCRGSRYLIVIKPVILAYKFEPF